MFKRIRENFSIRRSRRRTQDQQDDDIAAEEQLGGDDDDISFEASVKEEASKYVNGSEDYDLSVEGDDLNALRSDSDPDQDLLLKEEDFRPELEVPEWNDSKYFLPVNESNLASVGRNLSMLGSFKKQIDSECIEEIPNDMTPLLLKKLERDKTSQQHQYNDEQEPFVLEKSHVGVFAYLTFHWFVPLLKLGNSKEQLDPKDLDAIPLPPSCRTDHVSNAFETYWNQEKHKAKTSHITGKTYEPSIAKCLFRAYGKDYLKAGFFKLFHDMNVFVGPIVLHGLIQFLRDPNAPLRQGLALTATVTISQTIMSFCLRHYFFKCYLCGLRMRTAIVVAVYKKALLLSSAERQRRTVGEIVNFMTIDAQRIQDLSTYLHALWYSFIQIGLAIYFLWQQLGSSCLGGLAVICIMIPVNKLIAAWMGRLQRKLMTSRDLRVDVNNEVLGSMKVIKLQAWEGSFQKRILDLRKIELKQLYHYVMANSISIMMVRSWY